MGDNMGDSRGAMTSRRRVEMALAHQEPDRVPIDLNLHAASYVALKQYLGLEIEDDDPKPNAAMEVIPHPRVLQKLGVDLTSLKLSSPQRRPRRPMSDDLVEDQWGVGWRHVTQAGGYSYLEPVHHPLAKATRADLVRYPWPDPTTLGSDDGLAESAHRLYEATDLALVGRFGGPIIETAVYLLGWEEWLLRTAGQPDFAGELLDRITDIQIALDQTGIRAAGQYLSIFKASGEDLGMQTGPLYSPRCFTNLLLPRLRRRWQAAHDALRRVNSRAKVMLHSCGAIRPFIPDLIDAGVQVLDPVQPQAQGMDGETLKQLFPRLVFHGGIDIQDVLPHGTPEDVEREVCRCLRAFAPGGGYILAPAHAVQPDVPAENVVAMCRATRRWGQYPLDLEASASRFVVDSPAG